jgi:hypothetical protein
MLSRGVEAHCDSWKRNGKDMGAHDTEGKRASPRTSPPLQEKSDPAGHDEQGMRMTFTLGH